MMATKRFNPDGVDFDEWIDPKAVAAYEETRKPHKERPVPLHELVAVGVLNQDHLHAGGFMMDLRAAAFPHMGYPTHKSKSGFTFHDGPLGMDAETFYTRIFNGWAELVEGKRIQRVNGMLAWQSNIIAQACWPTAGRNTTAWLQQNRQSTIDSFERLIIILDIYKKLVENTIKDVENRAQNLI